MNAIHVHQTSIKSSSSKLTGPFGGKNSAFPFGEKLENAESGCVAGCKTNIYRCMDICRCPDNQTCVDVK